MNGLFIRLSQQSDNKRGAKVPAAKQGIGSPQNRHIECFAEIPDIVVDIRDNS
jgi:hypothetical protein